MAELPLNYPGESQIEQCAICLEKCENRSFPQYCLHGFCFTCLLQWSKVKPVCPLCLKPFSTVIHNIKSNQEHDELNIDPFWQEEVLSEELLANSSIEQHLMQAAAAYFRSRSWMESSSDESNSDTSSESSWVTINTDDSEDDFPTMHDIFSQQLAFSDQRLGTINAFMSIHSHLPTLHNDPVTFLSGIVHRLLEDASSSDEDNELKDTGTSRPYDVAEKAKSPSLRTPIVL